VNLQASGAVERAEAEAIYDQGREVVVAVLLRMDAQIEALTERVARQEERIAQLERRLGRNSRNSSQPPSADPPGSPPRRGKDASGRKRGSQPGHEGKGRPLVPAWAVDEFVDHWPSACGCGHVLAESELVADGDPARHQVGELPPITVIVTEHRCQRVRCPECGRRPRGALPSGVADSAFGPRYHAAVAVLSVRNRISRRDVVELCEQLFGSRISTGTVDAILARVGDALAEPYADLLDRVRAARHLNMDETGWRLKGAQRALWGAFTDRHAALAVAPDRSEDHARDLLADTTAIVTSDRRWAYNHLPLARRHICWAHLQRDFQAHAEGIRGERELGQRGLEICDELFWAWEIYQHTGDRHELQRRVRVLPAQTAASRARRQRRPLPVRPPLRAQRAQGLADAMDLRQTRRRAPDQQPRRTRAARRRHLPQTLARGPVQRRRTTRRTAALGAHHLPTPTPQPARLPHRHPHRHTRGHPAPLLA
jgi:transposase